MIQDGLARPGLKSSRKEEHFAFKLLSTPYSIPLLYTRYESEVQLTPVNKFRQL